MCGQLGVVLGTKKRSGADLSYLKWLFAYLLLLSERRGPYATGVAYLKQDGRHSIVKRPVPASEFIKEKALVRLLAEVDDRTTLLMGHTRLPTQGSHLDNENNQPMVVGRRLIGTHNGHLTNADALFKQLDLPRFAEVDSEIIFRMAEAALRDGCIDVTALKEQLALCQGLMSAVVASKLDPKAVVVVKGNKPLELRYHPEHRAIVYASDAEYLDVALPPETGWQEVATKPMTVMTLRCEDLPDFDSQPFSMRTAGKRGFQRYVEPQRGDRRLR